MRGMIGAALYLLAPTSVRAEVVVQPGVPFTATQLVAAVSVRGGPNEAALDVAISSPNPGRIVLVMPQGRWEIEIGAVSGERAARVVALHIVELGGRPPAAHSAATIASPEVRVADAPRAPVPYRFAAFAVAARGTHAGDLTSAGGALEVARTGRWIIGGGFGWQHGLSPDRAPGMPFSADLFRIRAIAGVTVGSLELVAAGFAGRNIVDGGSGTVSRWDLGGATEVRAALPLSDGWAFVIAAGVEVYRERIEVKLETAPLAPPQPSPLIGATPRVAVGGGLGLAWTGEWVR